MSCCDSDLQQLLLLFHTHLWMCCVCVLFVCMCACTWVCRNRWKLEVKFRLLHHCFHLVSLLFWCVLVCGGGQCFVCCAHEMWIYVFMCDVCMHVCVVCLCGCVHVQCLCRCACMCKWMTHVCLFPERLEGVTQLVPKLPYKMGLLWWKDIMVAAPRLSLLL